MHNLIPKPASLTPLAGVFVISPTTKIIAPDAEAAAPGKLLADSIEQHTKLKPAIVNADPGSENIQLKLNDNTSLGEEGYELSIQPDAVLISALCPAGLFYGIQTFRQILSAHQTTHSLPAISITDSPRFRWRGAMLDVARHFYSVEDVKRFIDLIAHYKMNRLHLGLTNDQGWRIEIKSWPRLTEIGAQTQVNGGGGGFYTQEQYKEIVDYARSRYVMVIPEIDTPGHTNAALASYAELNVSEEAPNLYEGIEVGFSSLSINMEITYRFLDDVIRELATISPAPYIHIGGDEAKATPKEDYVKFIKRMQGIVQSHGKQVIGWAEIGEAELHPTTIAQHWDKTVYLQAKQQGCKIILSPANKTYLDSKYDENCQLGLNWMGYTSVKDSCNWEPGTFMPKLEETDILGVEVAVWSDTLRSFNDVEYMAFPRLPGLAELAWSPKGLSWDEYKVRLAKHGRHMQALDINFFKAPDVNWE